MKIDNVSNVNFKSIISGRHGRFLEKRAAEGTRELLSKMNKETVYKENREKTNWESSILSSLSQGNKIKFIDNRMYVRPITDSQKFEFDCTLEIGSTKLCINSQTGEIVRYKRGFFSTWSYIMNRANDYIQKFLVNYDNPEIVKKNRFGIAGFTLKGVEIIRRAQLGLQK